MRESKRSGRKWDGDELKYRFERSFGISGGEQESVPGSDGHGERPIEMLISLSLE